VNDIIGGKSAVAAPAVKWLVVDEDSGGQRLDNFLLRHLKGVPKTHVYRIIRSGEVRINKGRCSPESRVQPGDEVRLPPLRLSGKAADKAVRPPPGREFPILFETGRGGRARWLGRELWCDRAAASGPAPGQMAGAGAPAGP
jgi:23S rRNA pseudouridine955/2504/2580 synthase